MPKLTDTQTIILTGAASSPGNLAMQLPKGLAGAAAKMAVSKMIERGWLEEIDANLRRHEPLWRETGDGHGTTLIATEAGLDAIGIDPVVASTVSTIRKAQTAVKSTEVPADASEGLKPKLVSIRQCTKQALLIDMLQRPEGASITEIVEATSWQAHTARGAISGALKKKLGLEIVSTNDRERGRCYNIAAVK